MSLDEVLQLFAVCVACGLALGWIMRLESRHAELTSNYRADLTLHTIAALNKRARRSKV